VSVVLCVCVMSVLDGWCRLCLAVLVAVGFFDCWAVVCVIFHRLLSRLSPFLSARVAFSCSIFPVVRVCFVRVSSVVRCKL